MSVTSGFFNSINGDRKYDAKQMSSIFEGMISDGVYPTYGSLFSVSPGSSGTNVLVGTGRAWFNNVWLLNDSALSLELGPSELLLDRYDAIVIDIDHSDEVRNGTIKMVSGTPSDEPEKPEMIHDIDHNQYPIAYVFRPYNSESIAAGDIEYVVGTSACPMAKSLLSQSITAESLGAINVSMHRLIFRGKNLGIEFTAAQKEAIANGTFDDLFIGDYWTDSTDPTLRWRIVDINYWFQTGKSSSPANINNERHIVVMPDKQLVSAPFHALKGPISYVESDMYTTVLPSLKPIVENVFGNYIYKRTNFFPYRTHTAADSEYGYYEWSDWYDSELEIPDEIMMFGSIIGGQRDAVPYRMASGQLALFRVNPSLAVNSGFGAMWLRDVYTQRGANRISLWYGGQLMVEDQDTSRGVRPVFAIKGTPSID